jgi:hypothetical protein
LRDFVGLIGRIGQNRHVDRARYKIGCEDHYDPVVQVLVAELASITAGVTFHTVCKKYEPKLEH